MHFNTTALNISFYSYVVSLHMMFIIMIARDCIATYYHLKYSQNQWHAEGEISTGGACQTPLIL